MGGGSFCCTGYYTNRELISMPNSIQNQKNTKKKLASKKKKNSKQDLGKGVKKKKKSKFSLTKISKVGSPKKSKLKVQKQPSVRKKDIQKKTNKNKSLFTSTSMTYLNQKINPNIQLYATAWKHSEALAKNVYTAKELALACLAQADRLKKLSVFLNLNEKFILQQAEESDARRARGLTLGPLDGIPVSIKDNICEKDVQLTCASKFLENYKSPFDATVIEKLRAAGAVLFGRTNMDEFAMGSSTENSAYQKTLNPWNEKCVPGGSSGGAAVCVASSITPLALGSDTGGSVRQPASFCGVVGMRPSYGRVSRYGLVAFASSLDIIGVFARSVSDSALLLSSIHGHDRKDSTSEIKTEELPILAKLSIPKKEDLKKLKIGLQLGKEGETEPLVRERTLKAVRWIKENWDAEVVDVTFELEKYAIAVYYILATAEASSNLGRFDGIRYGVRASKSEDLKQLYIQSRTNGFGAEVRRRILLGTFVLSSGYYDAYYKRAQKLRQCIQNEFSTHFQKLDFILSPTSPFPAFHFGEKKDPLAMYRSDLFTIPSALAGLPCLNITMGLSNGLPLGLQLIAPEMADQKILEYAAALEELIQEKMIRECPKDTIDYSQFCS